MSNHEFVKCALSVMAERRRVTDVMHQASDGTQFNVNRVFFQVRRLFVQLLGYRLRNLSDF
jgi:hypothetical protein